MNNNTANLLQQIEANIKLLSEIDNVIANQKKIKETLLESNQVLLSQVASSDSVVDDVKDNPNLKFSKTKATVNAGNQVDAVASLEKQGLSHCVAYKASLNMTEVNKLDDDILEKLAFIRKPVVKMLTYKVDKIPTKVAMD